jgi:hypothetical protein
MTINEIIEAMKCLFFICFLAFIFMRGIKYLFSKLLGEGYPETTSCITIIITVGLTMICLISVLYFGIER